MKTFIKHTKQEIVWLASIKKEWKRRGYSYKVNSFGKVYKEVK